MNLREIIINSLRNRILPLVTRIQLFLSPSYLWGRAGEFIRTFLQRTLNVRPRDKDDYYPMARWLVSKRLAYAIVIFLGVGCLAYLITSKDSLVPGKGNNHIKTYDYNNILLKFAKGQVRIRGKSGYLAYEGEVSDAACNGSGKLMNPKGVVVYQGTFEASKYEGTGKMFYEDGTLHYTGAFHQNQFEGDGKLYRPSGLMEYEGTFSQNMKDGFGTLYDAAGEQVYAGEFSMDEVLYASLLGKTTEEMATTYSGKRKLYVNGVERVRVCEDIGAMTEELFDDNSIDSNATVTAVYVLSDSIRIGGRRYEAFEELRAELGEETYIGESYATLPELLVINRLNESSDADVINGPAEITETNKFTEYTEVEGFQEDYVVWLHSYEKDGLVYNFVSSREDDEFVFYYVLNNDLSEQN